VARNVREFTDRVAVMVSRGRTGMGASCWICWKVPASIRPAFQRDAAFSTTVKTRIIARNQQVVRVDRERRAPLPPSKLGVPGTTWTASSGAWMPSSSPTTAKACSPNRWRIICRTAGAHGKILTVDPHPYTSLSWPGATAIKPNRAEAFMAAGLPPSDPVTPVLSDQPLLEAGNRLLQLWNTGSVLITLGEHGMLLFHGGSQPYPIPTRAKDVFDVSGAGDTALAVFTLGLAAGATPAEAAELANRASGIAVGKLGTATATAANSRRPLPSYEPGQSRILRPRRHPHGRGPLLAAIPPESASSGRSRGSAEVEGGRLPPRSSLPTRAASRAA